MSSFTGECCAGANDLASSTGAPKPVPAACRECGTVGSRVERRTLAHMLLPDRFERAGERKYRFCELVKCETVYYSTDGEVVFTGSDLRQRVGIKAGADPSAPVCYCFGFSVGDLEAETRSGTTTIPDRIRELVRARICACEVRNPSGRCCLAEIGRIVKRFEARPSPDPECSGGHCGSDHSQREGV
jgi:hypothetical protein